MDFLRSKALNNIPAKKLHIKLLEVVAGCPLCSKKDFKDGFDGLCPRCSVIHSAYIRYKEANIPLEYWDLKMEKDFHGNRILSDKYHEITANLASCYAAGVSFCFAGTHGVGKSLTTTCILKKAVQKGYSALYTTLSDIVNVLIQGDYEDKSLARKELVMVDFLTIDEWDNRFVSSEASADLYARTLETIFRTRTSNKLPIFMCSNSPNVLESLTDGALKASLSSLMNKNSLKQISVFGEDFRKKE